jgi:AraC-like DNA-binding protein
MGRGKRHRRAARLAVVGLGRQADSGSLAIAGPWERHGYSADAIRAAWEESDGSVAETARLLKREGHAGKQLVRRWLIALGCHAPRPQEPRVTRQQVLDAVERHGGGRGAVKLAAAELGVTSAAISYHLTRSDANVIHPRPSDEELTDAWFRGGEHPGGAAAILGRHERVMREWLKELGLYQPQQHKPWQEADDERLRQDYESFARAGRLDELARELGTTVPSLSGRAKYLRLRATWQMKHRERTNEERRQLLEELLASGKSAARWQRDVGFTNRIVEDLRRHLPTEWARARDTARKADGRSPLHIGKDFELRTIAHLHKSFRRLYGLHFNDNDGSHGPGDIIGGGNGLYYSIQCESRELGRRLETDKALRVWAFAELQGNTIPLFARPNRDGGFEFLVIQSDDMATVSYEPFDWESHLAERARTMGERERKLAEMARPKAQRRQAA